MIIYFIVLEGLCSFVLSGEGNVFAIPYVLDGSLLPLPALYEECRPKRDKQPYEDIDFWIQCIFDLSQCLRCTTTFFSCWRVPVPIAKPDQPGYSNYSWECQVCLVMQQESVFKSILFAIIILDNIERLEILWEFTSEKSSQNLVLIMVHTFLNLLYWVPFMQWKML